MFNDILHSFAAAQLLVAEPAEESDHYEVPGPETDEFDGHDYDAEAKYGDIE